MHTTSHVLTAFSYLEAASGPDKPDAGVLQCARWIQYGVGFGIRPGAQVWFVSECRPSVPWDLRCSDFVPRDGDRLLQQAPGIQGM